MTPEQPSDPELRTVDVGGVPLAYTDEGQGLAVAAVHGLPGSARDFRWLAPALPAGLRLLRVEMPGFGDSPGRGFLGHRPAARVQVLRGFADALGLEAVLVLGHSFGGMVATEWAAADPRVRALALVNSVGRRIHRGLRRTMPPSRAVGMSVALRTPGLRTPLLGRFRESMTKAGFRHGLTDPVLVAMTDCLTHADWERHTENLAALRVPTLVAWADDDPLIETEISEDLYWACPQGPRICYPDGGHNLQKTRAVELAEALGTWVTDLS